MCPPVLIAASAAVTAGTAAYGVHQKKQAADKQDAALSKQAKQQKRSAAEEKLSADSEARSIRKKSFRTRRQGEATSAVASQAVSAGFGSRSFFAPA